MISVSQEDKATLTCFFDPHEITAGVGELQVPRRREMVIVHAAPPEVHNPTSDGARGMSVEAVRCARRLSSCARADLRCKSMPAPT